MFNFYIKVNTRNSRQEMTRCIQILRDHSGGEDDVEVAAEILLEGNKTEIVWNFCDSRFKRQVFSPAHLSQQGYDG